MKAPSDIIIITSDEPYSQMWHTQLIYADYLSIHNKVIYIAPPSKWRFENLFNWRTELKTESNNLCVFSYKNILPVVTKCFWHFNEWYNQQLLVKHLQKEKTTSILFWHYDSFRSAFNGKDFLKQFQIKRVYHVVDPYYKNPINKKLSQISNVIVITSTKNNIHYKTFEHKLINIPQCIDIEKSKTLVGLTSSIFNGTRPYTVLLGTISADLDFDILLEHVSEAEANLVVIGKISNLHSQKTKWEDLLAKKNVHYLGVLSPTEFYPILKNAIAGLILYTSKRRSTPFSPLKALNYLVASIPVISNSDCEIPSLIDKGIFMISGGAELKSILKKLEKYEVKFDKKEVEQYIQTVSIEKAVNDIVSKVY